ncbi:MULTISPECIES: hypothetical protein [unclassified Mucilaginibacter]|uniref:hypothetical protein n=1 Tax=unclassified Mucilaginibacter TaxID=2617802 RepID=UPI002AC92A21|nr:MULTISPECIES: hypothetical protein [unclassified Mucilaginibacter]MEB0262835.1 hypothetical protein [Mucilaginibacter sp. 10I4]MEB0277674.1 hypothetical protein [Mucilaginibacter sp. 10B2]MEB0301933.1 hypothetical protein [Mucilaginibacter sp. 5C4]WPX24699.1 hypothetical protein RHM67_05360 [Mucilaginibacter sp. 5C4]
MKNMDMQDKDIDSLFRSKLDNLEVEPSGQVWGGIASQMNKKKKPLGVYLSIAASLVLLSAGLYFVSNTTEIAKKPLQNAVAKNNKPVNAIIKPVTISPKVIEPQIENVAALNPVASHKQQVKVVKEQLILVKQEKVTQLAQAVQKTDVPVKFVVPDRSVPFNDKIDIPEDQPLKTNTLVQAKDAPASKVLAAVQVKKHRIRNFGDLINAVISKVDKRKDKLIEFSSPKDEDESTLSGLNLGFIKIKKTDQ